MDEYERAEGAILGAFVGDAAGAPLEFVRIIDEDRVRKALTFSGGGPINAGPGEITDDSELAMCQLHALHNKSPSEGFPWQNMREWYNRWYKSIPFDMGMTTGKALSIPLDVSLEEYLTEVNDVNRGSKANGSMMRMTPLAVWSRNLSRKEQKEMFRSDTKLTHPNRTLQDACGVYGVAIGELVKTGDIDHSLHEANEVALDALTEVDSWFEESQKEDFNLDQFSVDQQIGFAKWGFILAFHFLKTRAPYEDAIFQTLMKGGDTDTNAAIVGGLLGAAYGRAGIPADWVEAMLSYKYDENSLIGHDRPDFLQRDHVPGLIRELFDISK
ncbi:MAG: ADP-ribosylglycohydrolase family protein [Candidatus Kariarchaeaceae archaeon]